MNVIIISPGSWIRAAAVTLRGRPRHVARQSRRPLLSAAAASVLTVGVLSLVPATASAISHTPAWSVVPSPSARAPEDMLTAVSCSTATACMATGEQLSDPTGLDMTTLAKSWDGTSWAIQPTPQLARGDLSAVSCVSASACMAVGTYYTNPLINTLAEIWRSGAWSILPMPDIRGNLTGVSCASATSCMAVGSGGPGGSTLAESWNGTTWSVLPTPHLGGVTSDMAGVSCVAVSDCTAVGSVTFGDENETIVPVAEHWNGTAWTVQPTPSLSGGDVYLSAVSCTSATSCTAVGRTGGGMLAEHWDGTTWAIQPAAASVGGVPTAVSCTSDTACTAVAGSDVVRWNGTSWAIQQATETAEQLSAVSCTSATACTAVGTLTSPRLEGQVTVAERWNGASWAVQPTPGNPTAAVYNLLTGVSCSSATACTAVGDIDDPIGSNSGPWSLTEVWNGRQWAIKPAAIPPNPASATLTAVSCTSARACVAVGSYLRGSTGRLLAEGWNGTRWTIEPGSFLLTNATGDPVSVSCPSARACTVVTTSAALRWNGRRWALQHLPNPVQTQLTGVSCTSARSCMAVGKHAGRAFAERWNGRRWAIKRVPHSGFLLGVSCTSARRCTAVGSYNNQAAQAGLTLAARWNGRKWAIQRTPNPSAAKTNGSNTPLTGVSCTSARSCIAVGYDSPEFGHSNGNPLTESWNGKQWAITPNPNPNPVYGSRLQGVSCTSATTCTAIGYVIKGAAAATLVERYS